MVGCMTVFVSVPRDTGQSSSDCQTYCVSGWLYDSICFCTQRHWSEFQWLSDVLCQWLAVWQYLFLSIETLVRVPVTVGRTVSVVGCMTVFVSVYRDTGQSSSDCRTYCVDGWLYGNVFLSTETLVRVPVTVGRTTSTCPRSLIISSGRRTRTRSPPTSTSTYSNTRSVQRSFTYSNTMSVQCNFRWSQNSLL